MTFHFSTFFISSHIFTPSLREYFRLTITMNKRRNARTNSIVKEKKEKKKRSDDVHRGGKLVGGHHVHGMRRRISLSSNIHDACMSDVRTQSSPSWRTHTDTRTHTDELTSSSKFLCLFFVVYRAVSGIDASVSSPPRAEELSLARHELCFRNVRATHTNALSTYIHTCTCVCVCVCLRAYWRVQHARVYRAAIANACVWSGLTCTRELRAWLKKEKNRKSKVPRLVIHRHSAPPVRRHYLRFRGRTNFLIRVGAGGKCTSAARASSVSHRSRGFLSARERRE